MKPSRFVLALSALAVVGAACATEPAAPGRSYDEIYLVAPAQDPRNVLPRVSRELRDLGYTVHVVQQGQFLGRAEGNGFLVSGDGHLVTAAHALDGQRTATVWLGGTRYEADVVDLDAGKDLAMLKLRGSVPAGIKPLDVSSVARPALGADVYSVGHTGGAASRPSLSKGLVSALAGADGSPSHLQYASDGRHHGGGAPLLDGTGAVVGVVSRGGESLPESHRLAMRGNVVADYVRTAVSGTASGARAASVEEAAHAVAKVKAGLVPAGFQDKPRLVAALDYRSITDKWPRFREFSLTLSDLDSGQPLAVAGQRPNSVSQTEESVILGAMKDVRSALAKN